MLKRSRSYSRPNVSSSHFMERLRLSIACSVRSRSPSRTQTFNSTSRPFMVVKPSVRATRSPATRANRYDGLGHGSCHSAQWSSPPSPSSTRLPLHIRIGNCALAPLSLTVKTLSTSGRSGKKVIRRNPSDSHWVHSIPFEANKPMSCELAEGSISVSMAISCASPGRVRIRSLPSIVKAWAGSPSTITLVASIPSPLRRMVDEWSALALRATVSFERTRVLSSPSSNSRRVSGTNHGNGR